MYYYPSGLVQPIQGTSDTQARYAAVNLNNAIFSADGSVQVPANMGCSLYVSGHYTNMTGEWVFQVTPKISVKMMGSQSFQFHSYIGPGAPGHLGPLQKQLTARYGLRHDKFRLAIPAGAEYVFLKFPPTPLSPDAGGIVEQNILLPSSGTYRLAHGDTLLSVDHEVTMGLPLQGQWQDADQAGDQYLRRLSDIDTLTAPEYFVPQGIGYDPCMIDGGCPVTLLDQIYNATMEMTLYYFAVNRTADGLDRVPLRQVGPLWQPPGTTTAFSSGVGGTQILSTHAANFRVFLPLVVKPNYIPPDDPTGCPCGWFTTDGRMLDFIPEPN